MVFALGACGGGETTTVVERTVTAPSPEAEAPRDTGEPEAEEQREAESGGTSEKVPDVEGERLDVAESELDDLKIPYEEIGGGALGVVDVTAWVVCETRPGPGKSANGTVKLIVARPGEC